MPKSGHDFVIVRDCRFDNEAELIKSLGGTIIEVIRPDIEAVAEHDSENGINTELVDYQINNDRSLEQFEELCRFLAKDQLLGNDEEEETESLKKKNKGF